MCERWICLDLIGFCKVFSVCCLNLGSLLRKSMLLCVSEILLGFGIVLLFIIVVNDVLWWGEWNGCCCYCFCIDLVFIRFNIVVFFSVFLLFKFGNRLLIWLVSIVLFVFGGLISKRLCLLVVVIFSFCFFCFWLIILLRLCCSVWDIVLVGFGCLRVCLFFRNV